VLLALASLHRRSWRWIFCRWLRGQRGDCDVGGDGLSAALQQQEEWQEATQWRLGYQDQLIEHRQERRHAQGGKNKTIDVENVLQTNDKH
jgi:hypothetical protein